MVTAETLQLYSIYHDQLDSKIIYGFVVVHALFGGRGGGGGGGGGGDGGRQYHF